jgi:hypothetical protein
MSDNTRKQRRNNIIIMTVIIVLAVAGIILRWDFIRAEVGTVINNMFPG